MSNHRCGKLRTINEDDVEEDDDDIEDDNDNDLTLPKRLLSLYHVMLMSFGRPLASHFRVTLFPTATLREADGQMRTTWAASKNQSFYFSCSMSK